MTVSSAAGAVQPASAALAGHSMGTRWSARLVLPARTDLHALHLGIQARLDAVVAQMSDWEADSDLSRFNRAAAGQWQPLPDEFFTVLECALSIARQSGGAFDPTVGPLARAWGFGPAAAPRVPKAAVLEAARARVGWRRIALDADARRARQPGGAALDLSGIAKGFAVDQAARYLRGLGVPAALVEVGGELYGYGRKTDGESWRVLVETGGDRDTGQAMANPAGLGDGAPAPCVLALDGHAVATSGDRWHWFEHAGRRYAHTLDPRTGAPVEHATAAVTVMAGDAMHADAWATALTVLGAQAGFEFAQAHGIAARFVVHGNPVPEATMTDGFLRRLAA